MKKVSEMLFHEGTVLKIYPSDAQKHIIAVNDGAFRSVYNFLVASDREIHQLKKTGIYIRTVRERIDYLKQATKSASYIANALPYLKEKSVDSQAVANAIQNYHKAWKNMKKNHCGIPTFHRKGYVQSYQTSAHYNKGAEGIGDGNVRFEDEHHITLPKLGRIRFDGSPEIVRSLMNRKNTRIGTITVSRDAVGEYWASLQIGSDIAFREPFPKTGSSVGIDLNLIDLVNDSEGNAYENQRFRRKAQKKLAKAQRRMSRKAERARKEKRPLKTSRNYQKERRRAAFIERKTARQRDDYLNCLSRHLVKNHDLIAAEKLNVRNLLKNHRLVASISDAAWGTLLRMTEYKTDMYGKRVILVAPKYTTQTCSVCGYVMKGREKLPLSVREWDCPSCGAHHIRDVNAARNILKEAFESL